MIAAQPTAAPALNAGPAWGHAASPQAPPNWGVPAAQPAPQNWGPPPPLVQAAPHWGAPPQPAPAAQGNSAPYAAPAWSAPAPVPVAPAWGPVGQGPMAPPGSEPVQLAPTALEPAQSPVVPTTASALIAPLEPDQVPPNAPRTLAAFLITFETNPLGQFWPIHQGPTLVGRKDSGVELNLEIDHPTTSSRHATIHAAARPGRLKVEDLGSTNGTYVNERRLEPSERRPLEQGDTLRFGGFSVTVVLV